MIRGDLKGSKGTLYEGLPKRKRRQTTIITSQISLQKMQRRKLERVCEEGGARERHKQTRAGGEEREGCLLLLLSALVP